MLARVHDAEIEISEGPSSPQQGSNPLNGPPNKVSSRGRPFASEFEKVKGTGLENPIRSYCASRSRTELPGYVGLSPTSPSPFPV
jgi:hypothetical protein